MKLIQLPVFILLSSILTTSQAQQTIPFSDKRWNVKAQGHLLEAYQGKNSLYLMGGTALLRDAVFKNGIIDFEIYLSPQVSFSGLVFRMVDSINYEDLYLRAHLSGFPDAYQYTPAFNGIPAWQLYHDQFDGVNNGFVSWKPRGKIMGYNGILNFAFDRWMHVRLLVKDRQAELYLDNMEEPVAFIRELKMDGRAGVVGLQSNLGAAHFADFSYTPTDNVVFKTKDDGYRISTPAGAVMQWMVSGAFRESKIEKMNRLDPAWVESLKWKTMNAEASGLANLSRVSGILDSNNTVLVRMKVNSDRDQVKRLDIGYSDRVKVFFNGAALYSGDASFRTRDYRYLGTIGFFDALFLPLKKGENWISFAVSETFGGWGLMAKWENMEGIQ